MSTLSIHLRSILINFNIYYLSFICFFGIIGNFLNILVFSQKTLKHTGCSLYFICLSIIHIIVLAVPGLTQIIFAITGFDIALASVFWCKFFVYIILCGTLLSRGYICLISIDRWLITSLQARILGITTIICLIFSIHIPIGFNVKNNSCDSLTDSFYSTFYLIISLIITIVPFFIIVLFTSLVIIRILEKKRINKHTAPVKPIELNQRISNQNI